MDISRRGLMVSGLAAGIFGCAAAAPKSLAEARAGFRTRLVRSETSRLPVDRPPAGVLDLVSYASPVGPLTAYCSPRSTTAGRRPAILWITGGDCNSIGDVWSPSPRDNDQSARAFREAGMVMMFPTLRGGNLSKAPREGYFGELDDIVAAAKHLAAQDHVDPERIYLGGHSTGGTMALLAAEYSDLFRATFAFGPVARSTDYGDSPFGPPIDPADQTEGDLRAPILWLGSITRPVFIFEGDQRGNARSLLELRKSNANPLVQTFLVKGAGHFSVLAPVTSLIAQRIAADTGPQSSLAFTEAELAALV